MTKDTWFVCPTPATAAPSPRTTPLKPPTTPHHTSHEHHRYRLLLKELLKRTPTDHPDFNNVARALKIISKVASHINRTLKTYEQAMRVEFHEKHCI